MEKPAYDIAMKFVRDGGQPVYAEAALDIWDGDTFMNDFEPITSYADYSNFFEVTTFDFAMNVEPEDTGTGNQTRTGPAASRTGLHPGAPTSAHPGSGAAPAKAAGAKSQGDPFQRWRSMTEKEARAMRFGLSFDSFRFSRIIDAASPVFFQYCSKQLPFESATLVKRVATTIAPNKRQSVAFMRIDFKGVLLKSVKWSDGDLVTEACDFVCDELKFQYRQQRPDGTLKPAGTPALWVRTTDSKHSREGAS